MSIFDFFTGTKRPASGVTVLSRGQLVRNILALNRPTAPWHIVDGKSEGVDLIAEWRIVDAQWYEIFAKAGLSKVFRIYLKLDEAEKTVRAQDREYEIAWSAGVPKMSLSVKSFKGQSQSVEFGQAYGFTETGTLGEIYNYKFNTGEIKKPLQEAVTAGGWVYKGVAFAGL